MGTSPISIAVAARPYPGESCSGDAWHVDWHDHGCRIAVVDGLGHGPAAHETAAAAVAALAADPALDPDAAIRACHTALKGTRGAAGLVASVELAARRLIVAGAGNVEARLWQGGRTKQLLTDRGIVGATLPTLRPETVPLGPDWLLLVHSDGIRNRYDLDHLLAVETDTQGLADAILAEWSRPTDDAVILVARLGHGSPR